MTKLYRIYQLFTALLVVLIGLGFLLVLGFIAMLVQISNDNHSFYYQISEGGEDITNSFKRYENKIYVLLPSSGYHLVEEADVESFRGLGEDYGQQHIAVDKNNVYCGRTILEGLNPQKAKFIGYDYVTDGNLCYYCDRSSERTHIGFVREVMQTLLSAFKLAPKPLTYSHKSFKMRNIGELRSINTLAGLAVDEKYAYYKGKIIPNANPNNIHAIKTWRYDRLDNPINKTSEGFRYFTDGKQVYYGTEPLPISYQEDLHEVHTGRQNQPVYLYSAISGEVMAEGVMFPKEHAPYRFFSRNDAHIYHELWLGNDNNIYYYDFFEKEVKRMGENPLSIDAKEIFPSIWLDNGSVYFLQSFEEGTKSSRRSGGGVSSRSQITTFELLATSSTSWQKISTTRFGDVWQNGKTLYYFDKLGTDQLINHTIYRITDQNTVKQVLENQASTESIRKLIRDKKLQPAESTTLFQAKHTWRNSGDIVFYIVCGILFILIFLSRFYITQRKKLLDEPTKLLNSSRKPFDVLGGKLFLYKVFPKIYRLPDIKKVVFKIDSEAWRGEKYRAKITLYLHDSRSVSTKFTASFQSKENAEIYLKLLEEKLIKSGVKMDK